MRYTRRVSEPHLLLRRSVPSTLVPLIERMSFHIEPDISCSRFFGEACFTEESIAAYRQSRDPHDLRTTELGEFISSRLCGGLFLDLPCGVSSLREEGVDFDIPPLASALGAASCWEVDLSADVLSDRLPGSGEIREGGYALRERIGAEAMREEAGLRVTTMQDDVLGFLAKLSSSREVPLAIYVSALQPDAASIEHQDAIAAPYLEALYAELDRLCGPRDLVILCSSAMLCHGMDETRHPMIHPAVALPMRGLTLLRRDRYDKVHVFGRE